MISPDKRSAAPRSGPHPPVQIFTLWEPLQYEKYGLQDDEEFIILNPVRVLPCAIKARYGALDEDGNPDALHPNAARGHGMLDHFSDGDLLGSFLRQLHGLQNKEIYAVKPLVKVNEIITESYIFNVPAGPAGMDVPIDCRLITDSEESPSTFEVLERTLKTDDSFLGDVVMPANEEEFGFSELQVADEWNNFEIAVGEVDLMDEFEAAILNPDDEADEAEFETSAVLTPWQQSLQEIGVVERSVDYYLVDGDRHLGSVRFLVVGPGYMKATCRSHTNCFCTLPCNTQHYEKYLSLVKWLKEGETATPEDHHDSEIALKRSFGIQIRARKN